jgi:hypothetical protein
MRFKVSLMGIGLTMGIKLHEVEKDLMAFHCPGCGYGHCVTVHGHLNPQGASWDWNSSMDKPTFMPSILVNASFPSSRCHSNVKDGNIIFCADCFHSMKGQTVEIPDWDD